jgi:hypothetical protein
VLIGPSGCGKSTLLVNTARALVSSMDEEKNPKEPTPTCLVSIRVNKDPPATSEEQQKNEQLPAVQVFGQTATKIFTQIGAPPRRALIFKIIPREIKFEGGGLTIPIKFNPDAQRVTDILGLFLETAHEIGVERKAQGKPVPVLLWDEVCNWCGSGTLFCLVHPPPFPR